MTTVASDRTLSPEQRFVTCINQDNNRKNTNMKPNKYILPCAMFVAAIMAAASSAPAQMQTTGTPGSPERDHDH